MGGGGAELQIFKLPAFQPLKTWFASKELKKASVDLVEISGGTYETMAMMWHGDTRCVLFRGGRGSKKSPNDEATPKKLDLLNIVFYNFTSHTFPFCGWSIHPTVLVPT